MSRNIDREETTTTGEEVGDQMAFEKRDVRAKVNGNRGPGIGERKLGESYVVFLINDERRMIDSVEETIQSSFNFRGVGNFTFNCGTGHFRVIISRLVRERTRKGRLQPNISSGGANGFSDTMGGGNIFRARGVLDMLRGARVEPILLYAKGSKSEGGGKVSSGERDSVGPIAIVSGVDNKGNVIR